MIEWLDVGYLGLFLASFLAATIVPFSSEAILTAVLMAGFNPIWALITATLGNWLGGLTSYYIGYWGKYQWIEKYLRIPSEKSERFKIYVKGKEGWIAIFTWLPFVGDILAVALGLLKAPFLNVCIWMLIGKMARYAAWGYLTLRGMELIQ